MEREVVVRRAANSLAEYISCTECAWGVAVVATTSLNTESEINRIFERHECADFPTGDEDAGNLKFSLSCSECGSNNVPIPEDAPDDTCITCSTCGADLGSLGDLKGTIKSMAIEKAQESLNAALRDAFKGIEGVAFTETE